MKHLCKVLPFTPFTSLNLSGLRDKRQAFLLLSLAQKEKDFQDTPLTGNRIGDEGVQCLTEALKTNTVLTSLNLGCNTTLSTCFLIKMTIVTLLEQQMGLESSVPEH